MSGIKKFQRTKEDFFCLNCKVKNKGDGFTNHCSECFFSKHVDIFPGDRLETCWGMMKIFKIEKGKKDNYLIFHKCNKCGHFSKNKFREKKDNFNNFLKLVKKINYNK